MHEKHRPGTVSRNPKKPQAPVNTGNYWDVTKKAAYKTLVTNLEQ